MQTLKNIKLSRLCMQIEVEVRSFLSKEEYDRLLRFFQKEARFTSEEEQETLYFDGPQDLRIQKTDKSAKVWLKKGKMHDDYREEIEVPVAIEQFEHLKSLFLALGHAVSIIWLRKRISFDWEGITICLDDTKGYGRVIELEIMSNEVDKDK